MSRGANDSITEAEFVALPAALQRKYFSSLERLRIAHDGTFCSAGPRQYRHLSRRNARTRSQSHSARHSTLLKRRLSVHPAHAARSQRTTRASAAQPGVDNSWFQSLPPKIQRVQFSREEQILLAGQRDTVILDAADEAFYKCGRRSKSSTSSLSTAHRAASRHWAPNCMWSEEKPIDSAIAMEDGAFSDFAWLDEDDALDLRLDDYHAAIAETNNRIIELPKRKPSFRRNLSLSSGPFRRDSTSTGQGAPRHSAASSVVAHSSRPASTLPDSQRHRSNASISSIDPRAKHYQDPEARLKLRVYLASPQKFDEAVEFGFPSLEDRQRLQHTGTKTSPKLPHEPGRTFFSDDTPCLSEDEDEDEGNDDREEHDPRTPQDVEYHIQRSSRKSTSESSAVARSRQSEPYAQAATTGRETTIYMTLTRPDLRSPDDSKSVKGVNDEPLERVDLPCDDVPQSIWDTMPTEGSKVKKFWRRLRLK